MIWNPAQGGPGVPGSAVWGGNGSLLGWGSEVGGWACNSGVMR